MPAKEAEHFDTRRSMTSRRFSAGVIVVRKFPEGQRCLILRSYSNWDFPKGTVESGEAPFAAAQREVAEESALTDLEFRWGEVFCETAPYGSGKIARYYLALSSAGRVRLPISPELGRPEHHEFRWVNFTGAQKQLPPRLQPVLRRARDILNDKRAPSA